MLRGYLVLLLVVAGLFAGIWIGGHPENLPATVRSTFDLTPSGSVTDEAAALIRKKYFRETDPDQVEDASIRGMVKRLREEYHDRFTHYFDAKQNRKLTESLESRFSGVGMSVGSDTKHGLEVIHVFRNSPAREAGIKAGDVVVSVNGKSVIGESVNLIVAKVKGPEGTEVTLGVRARGKGKPIEQTMTRREIRVPVTSTRIRRVDGRKLGYVYFSNFSRGADRALRRAVDKVIDRGAEGVVLDLRANGGGLLDQAVLTSSIFLKEGSTVVETRSRTEGRHVYRAVGGNIDPPPMVVLVDRGTASAAEILAAALQSVNRVPVVGTRTFGKGLYQQVIPLDNGGSLDLSVGEFFTADGVSLAGKGLVPDVRVGQPRDAERDLQLDRALRVLAGEVSRTDSGDRGG
ncbi:MAG: S41 family peptidase [Solirubrobacterales bacterium]|nr:S41 family peptidase [Solirubrobacterales bacterium]